ncbi:hypothetical protein V6N11_010946 [Hibiscus sabdariffa]|uniref:Uncharacterized protein n=1 Tax=Hibiscus sabdariffa TaxID=183260 RepID=A0ABR2S7I7_9ROSI
MMDEASSDDKPSTFRTNSGRSEVVVVETTVCAALDRRWAVVAVVSIGLETLAGKGETLVEGLVEQGWIEPKCGLELLNRESGPGARRPRGDV